MKAWLKGLIAAVLGSAGGAVFQMYSDPSHIAAGDYGKLKSAAIGGALIGVAGYLAKSPREQAKDAPPEEAKK